MNTAIGIVILLLQFLLFLPEAWGLHPTATGRRALREATELRNSRGGSRILAATIREGKRFGIDHVLLLAIIEHESGFSTQLRGRHGEVGLMQIKPSTARWIAKKMRIPWRGPRDLENPEKNIRLGTAYLAYLREQFDAQSTHFLSAYNMGESKLKRFLNAKTLPVRYAQSVIRRYERLGGKSQL